MTDAITTAEQLKAPRRGQDPFLVFGLRVALVLLLVVGAAELLLRMPAVIERLPLPSVGSGSDLLDIKVEYLERYVRARGKVDCLFLGPSTVNRGIDPSMVSASFQAAAGRPLGCFNFGIDGMRLELALRLMPLLAAKYRPDFLVLSDFRPGDGRDALAWTANEHPWLQQFNGTRSADGWLLEHSRLVRYFLRARIWLTQPRLDRRLTNRRAQLTPAGFMPKQVVYRFDTPDNAKREARLSRRLAAMATREAPLDRLATLRDQAWMPPVLLLEMPLPERFRALFPGGADGYRATLDRVERQVGQPVLRTSELGLIPDDGWKDLRHVNDRGAAVLSRWLGKALAEATGDGRLPPPRASAGSRHRP